MIFLKIHTNTHTSTHNTRHAKNLRNPGRIHDPNLKQQVDVKRNLNDVRTRTLALTTASKSTLTSTTQPGFAVGGGHHSKGSCHGNAGFDSCVCGLSSSGHFTLTILLKFSKLF